MDDASAKAKARLDQHELDNRDLLAERARQKDETEKLFRQRRARDEQRDAEAVAAFKKMTKAKQKQYLAEQHAEDTLQELDHAPKTFKYVSRGVLSSSNILDAYMNETHMGSCLVLPFAMVLEDFAEEHQRVYWQVREGYTGIFTLITEAQTSDVYAFLKQYKVAERTEGYVILPISTQRENSGHQCALILDMQAKAVMFLNPMNTGRIMHHDEYPHQLIINMLVIGEVSHFLWDHDDSPFQGFGYEDGIADISIAMLRAQVYFETHRPEGEHEGYCVPLTYYIMDAIVQYWAYAREFNPTASILELMYAFVPAYVCVRTPQTDKAEFIEAFMAEIETLLGQKGPDSAFDKNCLVTNHPWDRFMAFAEGAFVTYLDGKRKELGYLEYLGDRSLFLESMGDHVIMDQSSVARRLRIQAKYVDISRVVKFIGDTALRRALDIELELEPEEESGQGDA